MRFLYLATLALLLGAITACASPAPLATPARPPLVVPTSVPAQPTAQPAPGLVTATPEPNVAFATATPAVTSEITPTPPAATDVPVVPVQSDSKLVGSYGGILTTADGTGSIVTLELGLDGTTTLVTQSLSTGAQTVEHGTWAADGESARATFSQRDGQPEDNRIVWMLQGDQLISTEFSKTEYGTVGLPLARVGTGKIVSAGAQGVSFSFDSSLAQSAQGTLLPQHPVEQAPALGGGAPQGVQFVFGGQALPDFFDPTKPQVYVYPVDGLKALDPAVKKNVEALQQILDDGTVDPNAQIPVFPLIPASQVFHAQAHIIDFVNGTGISFITYYAQDVAPLRPAQVFWTFQGITLDGKYFVSAFWNIGSPALPPETPAISGADYDAFTKQYTAYIDNITKSLDRLPSAGFTPNLSLLENMARSIHAEPQFPDVTPLPPATAEVQGTPAPQATTGAQSEATPAAPTGQTLNADFNGVSFSFDSAVAKSAQGVTVPAVAIDPSVPGGLSMGGPEHTAFGFDGNKITSEVSPFQAQVRVYPTDALEALDPAIAREALALKTLLQVKPAAITDPVPVLPLFNAQQVVHPQLKYLNFKNGQGVRVVTFYAQSPAPITNDGLFYTFQGMSADGKWYIIAFFPVRTDKLPDTFKDANITDTAAWMKGFSKYLKDTDTMLSGLPSDAFTPNLDSLDQLIESLQVPN